MCLHLVLFVVRDNDGHRGLHLSSRRQRQMWRRDRLKGAVNLSLSQQRYLTASEASLDALLTYQPTDDDFSLVEANSYSRYLFRGACDVLRSMNLAEQTRYLGLSSEFKNAKNVAELGVPYEAHLAIHSDKIAPQWKKVQVVKAG